MKQVKQFLRRRLALLLACLMVFTMMPVSAFADETPQEAPTETQDISTESLETSAETQAAADTVEPQTTSYTDENGLEYYLYDTYAVVTDYSGTATELVVPAEVQGLPVTSIAGGAFEFCTTLTSIDLPDSITYIGYFAFSRCTSLKSIDFPDSIKSMEFAALYGCQALESIEWPDSLTYIPWNAVAYCTGLTTLTIPKSVTSIAYYATAGCSSLSDVYYGGTASEWELVSIGSDNDGIENATIHFSDDSTPGGDSGEDTEPAVDTHDTLEELTDLDYLLFAEIAYADGISGMAEKTVAEILNDKWDDEWNDMGITYAEAYGDIANWKLHKTWSYATGFAAVEFLNADNEAVVSFCGSRPLNFDNMLGKTWDVIADWIVNDLPMEVLDLLGPQVKNAINTYIEVAMENPVNIKFTGHSLGGALADIASAYSGYEAISFNAISALDVAYANYPHEMSRMFTGVDQWNITDHTNENDILAGMYEEKVDKLNLPLKPYKAHSNNGKASNYVAYHGLASIVQVDKNGKAELTGVSGTYMPSVPMTRLLAGDLSIIHLGTTGNDTFIQGLTYLIPRAAYGGNGYDDIVASIMSDTLIGGKGNDQLDGDYLNDTYIYYKGDGHDYIRDIAGNDSLYLYGFSSSDVIEVVDDDAINTIDITCNGETIISIYKNGREYTGFTLQSFKVHVQKDGMKTTYNITEYFNTRKYGSRILVACPVDVEILDADGNVVYTLTDGAAGKAYTDYGDFYVFEEENGEYGKALNLIEGYTARIVGGGEGTMDVTYQVPVDGELSDPITLTDVPVTDSLVATIEEDDNGTVYLVIDTDGDGNADEERRFEGQLVMGDVNEDGAIDNIDAMLVMQYTVGIIGDDGLVAQAADVDGSGSADNVDAMLIMQYAVGIITEFPSQQ